MTTTPINGIPCVVLTPKHKPMSHMTEEEFEAFLETLRQCKKCGVLLKVRKFPMTQARGKLMIWCRKCLNHYIHEWRKKKAKERANV